MANKIEQPVKIKMLSENDQDVVVEETKEIDKENLINEQAINYGTGNVQNTIPTNYKFGRKVLKIPVTKNGLNETVIAKYLPHIFRDLSKNISDYKHLYNVYKGKSNIMLKQRPFNSDKTNSIVDERHPYSMVEFKKGYMYGNDVKYSCSDETMCTDDITWINKYMKDQNKASKNVKMEEDVSIGGYCNRVIFPKSSGTLTDIKRNAPFDIYNLDFCSSFIVYSSTYTAEKLFGGIITTIDSPNPDDVKYEIMIYDHNFSYRFTCSDFSSFLVEPKLIKKDRHYIGMCPFVEYKSNYARMGIVEIVEPMNDAINIISSNSVDNVIDYVNSILVVYNQTMNKETKRNIEDAGAMELLSIDPSRPAEAKYLVNALNHGDVNTKYEALVKVMYNVVGVPQASTQSTSGGDTGQARLLGGGWSRADIVALQDEACLAQAEREMLEICISICNKYPACPVNEIYASDIEINFNRTKNDNLLVKTQSLQNLISMNMPKETALNIVGVTANPHEVAHDWEANEEKKNKAIEKQQEAVVNKQVIEEPEKEKDKLSKDEKDLQEQNVEK